MEPALSRRLVSEIWPSAATGTSLTFGTLDDRDHLDVSSHIQAGGVVFADGIEADHLKLDWGRRLEVSVAETCLNLVRG